MNKLSIIIPAYNAEKSIGLLLEDILNLDVLNYEVIVVNDGSTDKTLSIVEQYTSSHDVIKLVNQKNQGVSSARNHGLKVCEGEYITFFDADDRIEVSRFKKFFTESIQAGADYSFTGYSETNYINKNKKDVLAIGEGYYDLENFMNVFFENLKVNLISYPINKIFLKSIIEKFNIQFIEGVHFAEDLLFNLDYINVSESFYISDSNYYVYQKYFNENSLSSKFNMGFWDARKLVYEKLNFVKARISQYDMFEYSQNTYASNVIIYTSRQIVNQNKPLQLIIEDLKTFAEDEYLKGILNKDVHITKRQKILFNLLGKNRVYSVYFFWKTFEFKDALRKLKGGK